MRVIVVSAPGPQGPAGPIGPSGSVSASYAVTASYALTGGDASQPITIANNINGNLLISSGSSTNIRGISDLFYSSSNDVQNSGYLQLGPNVSLVQSGTLYRSYDINNVLTQTGSAPLYRNTIALGSSLIVPYNSAFANPTIVYGYFNNPEILTSYGIRGGAVFTVGNGSVSSRNNGLTVFDALLLGPHSTEVELASTYAASLKAGILESEVIQVPGVLPLNICNTIVVYKDGYQTIISGSIIGNGGTISGFTNFQGTASFAQTASYALNGGTQPIGGSAGNVQFNGGTSALGGESAFNWDTTNKTLTVNSTTGPGDPKTIRSIDAYGGGSYLGGGNVDFGDSGLYDQANNYAIAAYNTAGNTYYYAGGYLMADVTNNQFVSYLPINANSGVVGNLTGTASYSNTSSYSTTASYALVSSGTITNAVTASYASRTLVKLIQDYEHGGHASGTGNGETLAAYGYDSSTAAAAFPLTAATWGSISTSTTYDSCVWQEMIMDLSNRISGFIQSADNRRYTLNHRLYLPATSSLLSSTTNPYMFGVDGRGCMIVDTRTGSELSGALFTKSPVNSTAANNFDIEYAWNIQNMRLYGPGMATASAFQIGSGKRCLFYNLDMINYHTGFIGSQLLNTVFDRINSQCEIDIKFTEGWWPGAVPGETVSQITVNNSRFRSDSSSSIGLYISNCDSSEGSKLQFEGASGSYAIFYDSLSGASVIKNAYFKNVRFESETKYRNALIGFKGRDTFNFIVELGWHQCTEPGTYLIETEAYDGTSPTVVLKYFENNGGNGTFKINNLNQGTCFDLTSVRLPGSPASAADILASGTTIFDGAMPSSNRLRYIPPMPT